MTEKLMYPSPYPSPTLEGEREVMRRTSTLRQAQDRQAQDERGGGSPRTCGSIAEAEE
ncbi:MAG: hypothetical protein ACREOP_10140 [Thermodesulfobacteriota bacterium]